MTYHDEYEDVEDDDQQNWYHGLDEYENLTCRLSLWLISHIALHRLVVEAVPAEYLRDNTSGRYRT